MELKIEEEGYDVPSFMSVGDYVKIFKVKDFFLIDLYQSPRMCTNPRLNRSYRVLASFLFQTNL